MENRKIMVEVTEEEYEKIKSGALDKDVPTYETIKKDFLENISEEDARAIFEIHCLSFLRSATDEELISQIVSRTKGKTQRAISEPVSCQEYTLMGGTLRKITKRDYAKYDTPIIQSEDEFTWTLKIQGEVAPKF